MAAYCCGVIKRSKKIYDLSGIIILIVLSFLKLVLLWINIDPTKFGNVTNSTMMNYGIWLQVVTTLVLSMVFTIIGLRTYEYKWTLLEYYHEIDEEFAKVFHSNLIQSQMKKLILALLSYGGILLIALLCMTFCLLSSLTLDKKTLCYIGLSVFISNVSVLSSENQLNSSQIFILTRYSVINNVLLQLLIDSPEAKQRSVIIGDDLLSRKEFQYTKYRNNFSCKHVLLRDQLEISTIAKSEKAWLKREDLRNQKKKMEKIQKESQTFSAFKVLIDKKSYFTKYTFTKESTPEDIMRKLDQLFILHDKLTDCVDNLNDMCGLEMQLVTLSIFVYVIFGLFSRYCVWMNYQHEAANIATMNIFWIFAYVQALVFNIYTGTELVNRAKETPLILHRIMCTTSDADVLEKLFQLSEMLLNRIPVLGCGLLVWDWKYLSSLIGGVCMYLIILIQFYVSSNN